MAQFQNFFATRLYTDIGAADTEITLEAAPTVTTGRMTLEARNSTQREIIEYTGVSGNQLTGVTRGAGGTTAKTHIKGALVEMNVTAEDLQDLYDAFAAFSAANNDWRPSVEVPSAVVLNGNRSYNLTFSGEDLTSILSPGMRLRLTRNTAAPTQCTSLNGSSQYFSKSSPTGMTFTDDFVASAWVKLNAYGTVSMIASRYNGTSGWAFFIAADGTVNLQGYNASSANYSKVISGQSIPLNRWVHVAAQLDMSSFTASATTSYVMIDGVSVLVTVARAGTNPTALVQAGNLEIGSYNAGTLPFKGKLAQVAIFSAKVTQANMRSYMSQTLAGTETSLVSAYSFNNSLNDLNTTNANNLTAQGSAAATNADSPFGTQGDGSISSTLEYAIVQAISFSTDTTAVVQVPEGCMIPTSGTISAMDYSGVKTPIGFPPDPAKWTVAATYGTSRTTQSTSLASLTDQFTLPIGCWRVTFEGTVQLSSSTTTSFVGVVILSSDGSTQTHTGLTAHIYVRSPSAAANNQGDRATFEDFVAVTSATTFTMMGAVNNANVTLTVNRTGEPASTTQDTRIRAINGLL
jgi:hypothetical protein